MAKVAKSRQSVKEIAKKSLKRVFIPPSLSLSLLTLYVHVDRLAAVGGVEDVVAAVAVAVDPAPGRPEHDPGGEVAHAVGILGLHVRLDGWNGGSSRYQDQVLSLSLSLSRQCCQTASNGNPGRGTLLTS